jgi:hypothetical protein
LLHQEKQNGTDAPACSLRLRGDPDSAIQRPQGLECISQQSHWPLDPRHGGQAVAYADSMDRLQDLGDVRIQPAGLVLVLRRFGQQERI